FSVGRPPGVTDSQLSGQRLAGKTAFQLGKASLRLAHPQRFPIVHRQTRGIISAVFQLPKPFHKDALGLFRSDISDNATHRSGKPPLSSGPPRSLTGREPTVLSVLSFSLQAWRPSGLPGIAPERVVKRVAPFFSAPAPRPRCRAGRHPPMIRSTSTSSTAAARRSPGAYGNKDGLASGLSPGLTPFQEKIRRHIHRLCKQPELRVAFVPNRHPQSLSGQLPPDRFGNLFH